MRTVHHRPFNLGRDVETILNGFFDLADSGSSWLPRTDVVETADTLTVRVAVPGFRVDDLDITVEDGVLRVGGTRPAESNESDASATYHRREIRSGSFTRSVRIPKAYNTEEVSAAYQDGILEIALAKRPETAPRRIEIAPSTSNLSHDDDAETPSS